jgi:hypothetical protein
LRPDAFSIACTSAASTVAKTSPSGNAHLEVELGELGLAVGTQVLVAHAARDLEVAVVPRDHQELLEDLRRLRQRIEVAG